MATSTHTIKVDGDTAEIEAKLERCIALAERFKEIWADLPMPDGVARLEPGDTAILRYDRLLSRDEVGKIKERFEALLPENRAVVFDGGLRIEGVAASE